MQMSYTELLDRGAERLKVNLPSAKSVPVYKSGFKKCLLALELDLTDDVAGEFLHDVEAFIRTVKDKLDLRGAAASQAGSHIRAYREAYEDLARGADLPPSFCAALKVLVDRLRRRSGAPLQLKALARDAGVPYHSLRDWVHGRHALSDRMLVAGFSFPFRA